MEDTTKAINKGIKMNITTTSTTIKALPVSKGTVKANNGVKENAAATIQRMTRRHSVISR
jgi:hypothetical protein